MSAKPTMMRNLFCAALAALLGGCALWDDMFDRPQTVPVRELKQLPDCGARGQGPQPKVHYFADAAALRSWAQQRNATVDAAAEGSAEPEGPFALVELGERRLEGYGLLISPEAILHTGGRLVLESTFFYAAQPGGRQADASPCVLLELPPRHYSAIDLYDQEGARQAHARTKGEQSQ